MKTFGDIDSKFRFVILAAKRAKQLLKGSKPRIKSKSKNPIRIAQNEMRLGVIAYEIILPKKEEVLEPEDQIFIGDEIKEEMDGAGDDIEDESKFEEDEESEGDANEDSEEESLDESEEEEKE